MNVVQVLRLPLDIDLGGFVEMLQRLQVWHRVSVEGDEQVLWVAEPMAEQIRTLYQHYPEGDPNGEVQRAEPLPPAPARPSRPGFVEQLRSSKATAAVLLLSVVVAVVTGLGDNLATLRWLTFLDFQVNGDYVYFTPLDVSLQAGQWWRLITPMLVHFSFLHLAMNGLWYLELGRRIEQRQGRWVLLGLTLVFGLVSNAAQYLFEGASLFGGLSGVLYGLLGHVWLYQWLAPDTAFRLPRGTVAMMLIWLLLCLTGFITLLGFGQIANAAHVGGLLVGCLSGLLGGALARRKLTA
ncbi:rhomboid family intramembrane serine protease [Pseudomonas sp. Marseille-P9899]|uniref:rhomboid family intramembrane serine protease n=1 Tax=Pseudomonas sp. Marseille-P9899 TaxID=2730401 RepID=UPI00158D41DB|nr:rhomboid family intramembrane serine protease [Pseudomonas sp. Marseille-P9899]